MATWHTQKICPRMILALERDVNPNSDLRGTDLNSADNKGNSSDVETFYSKDENFYILNPTNED